VRKKDQVAGHSIAQHLDHRCGGQLFSASISPQISLKECSFDLQGIGMIRAVGASAFLAIALAMPVQDAAAQDPLGGAILGGAAGAILGGAMGGGRGAAVGAIIGGATGAAIAAQGASRPGGYRYYHNGCYQQRPDGAWLVVAPEYCAPPPEPVADDYDGSHNGYQRGNRYGGGQCRELRQACLHKEELGEQGMGNCRRYRELCR
jgi:hypothetical protein